MAFDNIYNYQSEDSHSDDVSIEVSLIDPKYMIPTILIATNTPPTIKKYRRPFAI